MSVIVIPDVHLQTLDNLELYFNFSVYDLLYQINYTNHTDLIRLNTATFLYALACIVFELLSLKGSRNQCQVRGTAQNISKPNRK